MAAKKKSRQKLGKERAALSCAAPTDLKMWETLKEDVMRALIEIASIDPDQTWQLVKRRYVSLADERRCSSPAPDTHGLRAKLDATADEVSDLVHQLLRETIEAFPSSASLTEAWAAYQRSFRSDEAARELYLKRLTNQQLGLTDEES